MNEPEFLKAARHLAQKTLAEDKSSSAAERLGVLYETITARLPDADETETFLKLVKDLEAMYVDNADLADHLCEGALLPNGVSTSELATWTMLVSTIYNLDLTKTRD